MSQTWDVLWNGAVVLMEHRRHPPMIRLVSNIRAFQAGLDDVLRRQLPFAAARALTETARDAEKAVQERIGAAFDRPAPFTVRSVFVRPASKGRLVAVVGIKDRQAGYLRIQETGGSRKPQRRALVVPQAARLNTYGNMPRGAVKRYLARSDTFEATINGQPGIWQRQSRGRLRLLVAYEDTAAYEPRFGFEETARSTVAARFGGRFREALVAALATAR